MGPIRCSRCKAYINPFMSFVDQGKIFICNLCGFSNDTPREYLCNLGPDGRRRDANDRPELSRGTVEFVASKEFLVREPMPAVYFFLVDVSMNAVHTGATAAACSAISQALSDLPEGPRTMVGIATFDSAIHFYSLKRAQQQCCSIKFYLFILLNSVKFILLLQIDSDKTIVVTFKHDDKFQENSECAFQCALLYTTVYGQRRIRVINISLPCTSMLSNLFRYADLETQFTYIVKQAANGIASTPPSQVRDQVTSTCINILQSYRKYCASVSSSGQLILPEALKLLPLYTLALIKSIGLRNDGRIDDRSYWISIVSSISVFLAVPLVFPRMIALHDLASRDDEYSLIPNPLTLNSENIQDDGIYLLENGEDGFIYVGNAVNTATIEQIFGLSSLAGVPNQLVLEQFDNELSMKVNEVVNEIRRQRCSYLRLRLCQKGDPSGDFFRSLLVEDKAPGGLSYVEFLIHVHRQIQSKMT
uniref:Uncharacterized protein n=1 Tax=Avena sativa TaxID=4498 RepID=A0ACD5YJU3_AVESA